MTTSTEQSSTGEGLMEYIRQAGESRRKALREATQKTVAEIKAQGEADKKSFFLKEEESIRAKERETKTAIVGRAQWEARATVQRALGSTVEDFMRKARAKLDALIDGPEFGDCLPSLIKDAVEAAKSHITADTQSKLLVPEKHVENARLIVADLDIPASVEASDEARGGVIIDIGGTDYRITNTLFARFDNLEEDLRNMATNRLNKELNS